MLSRLWRMMSVGLLMICCVGRLLADDGQAGVVSAAGVLLEDILVEDFEANAYDSWTIVGDAFGKAPAQGTLPNQMPVAGFRGQGLVNTFADGDASTGTATSREFTIERSYLTFFIGGGNQPDRLSMQLLVDDQVVRAASGANSETLQWTSWLVSDLKGRKARLRIVDAATGSWGHISVDHIVLTDSPSFATYLEEDLEEYRAQPDYMDEPFRPQFHFSPEINWMNDPNGLVYHAGEYHMFYQYNPLGNTWGHMSWGHAVSPDLTHWQHLPLAIAERDGIMAFSGGCVVDHRNTTGFGLSAGGGATPPMVAVYTGHGHGEQVQNLSFSNDRGRTWQAYEHNPVLDLGKADFRDPKVFWHDETQRWIMVVSLAVEKVLIFYASDDLKSWRELSRFGPAGVIDKPNWECPDLFELPIDGEPGMKLWVLEVDIGSGSIAGGSGGEYFVGTFDGSRFQTMQKAQWVDYGRDFYAPISWENLPASDSRRIWIGWFNNWETCLVPTFPWRGCMSIPRELSLKKFAFNDEEPATYVLVQQPIVELQALRSRSLDLTTSSAAWPPIPVTEPDELTKMSFELEATLRPGTKGSVGFRIRTGPDEFTEVAYDCHMSAVHVDRTKSGNVDFHPSFAGRHVAPARRIDGAIKLHIFVDRSTIEVFINEGEAVISDRIFPTDPSAVLEAYASDGGSITNARLHHLKSVW